MSEKRFEVDVDHLLLVWDTEKNKRLEIEDIVDLLNHLHQENNILNKNEDDLKECTIENIKLKEENEQLKIANAKWLDKALQDKQIRYNNANHKELTQKYLQLKNENEELRQEMIHLKNDLQYYKTKSGSLEEELLSTRC